LERERSEHHDLLTLLQPVDHFGEIEVALTEAYDARMEALLRAVGHEHETLTRALRTLAQLIRLRELAAAVPLTGAVGLPSAAGRSSLAHLDDDGTRQRSAGRCSTPCRWCASDH
jgi:4-diphosphocytidyl-2C-methyl-D-erythritol kinase